MLNLTRKYRKEIIKKESAWIGVFWKLIAVISLGFTLPFLLVPIVGMIGYSEVLEEIAKLAVVIFVIDRFDTNCKKIFCGILFGFLFGVSENILYTFSNDSVYFLQRMYTTIPMHMMTVFIVVMFVAVDRRMWILGLLFAVIIHLTFNFYIVLI